jgi:FkbM family methyltransferase
LSSLVERGVKIRWINAGVGDKAGRFPFTVSYRDDSSSFVPTEQQAQRAGLRQTSVEVRTLNEIVASSDTPFPEIVKIDAEGFDLKVLSGASDLFGSTEMFLIEAAVCCQEYENTIAAVIERMASVGYRLVDFTDLNRSPKYGVLWLCEAAFIRNGSGLLDRATSYQ